MTTTPARPTPDTPQIDAIRARLAARHPGQWFTEHGRIFAGDPSSPDVTQIASMSGSRAWAPDADFICAAPQDIADLLAIIDDLAGTHPDAGDASRVTIEAHLAAVRAAGNVATAPPETLTDSGPGIRALIREA